MSGWTGHCPVRGFYEVYLNFGVTRVGPDNVRLEVFVCGRLRKDLELLDLIIFTSSITPLLIVRCSYTQQI
jgi:hypothetical protein